MALIQVERSVGRAWALGKLRRFLIGGAAGIVLGDRRLVPGRQVAGAGPRPSTDSTPSSPTLRTAAHAAGRDRANAEFIQQEQPDNTEARDIVGETDRLTSLVDALLAAGDEARERFDG
jgi:hypothetical protein